MKLKSNEDLQNDRRKKADAIFAEINFPSSVEDADGWESWTGLRTADTRLNTWSRNVFLLNEDPNLEEDYDTVRATFSIEFAPGTAIPLTAYLDEKELVLP
jgi:hypothetical protein